MKEGVNVKKIFILILLITLVGCTNNVQYQPLRVMDIITVQYHYERELEVDTSLDFQIVRVEIKVTNNSTNSFAFSQSAIKGMTNTNRFFRVYNMKRTTGEQLEVDTIDANSYQSYFLLLSIPTDESLSMISYDDYRGNLFERAVDRSVESTIPVYVDPELEQVQP